MAQPQYNDTYKQAKRSPLAMFEVQLHGYAEIDEFNGIKAGDRVHHQGERFYSAYWEGTATVLSVLEKDPSSWANKYGQRDIEIVVERDEPLLPGMPTVVLWADYHTEKVA